MRKHFLSNFPDGWCVEPMGQSLFVGCCGIGARRRALFCTCLVILGLLFLVGSVTAQVGSDRAVIPPHELRTFVATLDAAAATWDSKLDVFSDFKFNGSQKSSQGIFEFAASGVVARCKGFRRLSVRWDKLANGSFPFRSFDLYSSPDWVYLDYRPARVVKRASIEVPNLDETIVVAGGTILVQTSDRQSLTSQPLFPLPHPFAFCAGDNYGVVFGGLRLSPASVRGDSDSFYGGSGPLDVVAETLGVESFVMVAKRSSGGGAFTRAMEFKECSGIPMKVRDHYRRFGLGGELTSEIVSEVVDMAEVKEVGFVPHGLKVSMDALGIENVSVFSLDKESIRKSRGSDFEINLDSDTKKELFKFKGKGNSIDFRAFVNDMQKSG